MTYLQILALVICGPLGLMQAGHAFISLKDRETEFHIWQAFLLFVCLAVILAAFLGVHS